MHNQRVGVGDVNAALDDRRADQHIVLASRKFEHHLFEFALAHLPVPNGDVCLRHKAANLLGDDMDAAHAVVHEKHLPATIQLAQDRIAHDALVVLGNIRANGQAFFRRGLNRAHIARAGKRQIQRTWNRRSGQRQHIHLLLELFEFFLVHHAEPLFLVNDQQTQVFELHVVRKQAVCADDDIHRAGLDLFDDGALFLVRAKTREHFDGERKRREALAKRIEMLLCQHCCRHENGDLLAIVRGFERGAQRDFGFAVPHIADDQAIHRTRFFHIGFYVVNHAQLVFGLDVGERRFKFVLPLIVRRKRMTRHDFARGVQFEQFVRNVGDGFACALLDLAPFRRTEPTQHGWMSAWRDVSAQAINLMHRHIDRIAALIFDLQKFAFGSIQRDARQAAKDADAMINVDDVIANRQIRKERFGRSSFGFGGAARLGARPAE